MSEKPKTVAMESIAYHTHYDAAGTPVVHEAGDEYDLHDGQGMTADQLAESFISMGVAKRADAKPAKKAKADDDDPPARKHK